MPTPCRRSILLASLLVSGSLGFIPGHLVSQCGHLPRHGITRMAPSTPRQARIDVPQFRRQTSKDSSKRRKEKEIRRRWKNVLNPRDTDKYLPHPPDNRFRTNVAFASAVAILVSSFIGIVFISGEGAWRFYLAGGVCAATSHAIPVPIDVIKTRKQVDPTLYNKSFLEAGRYIRDTDGAGALVAGLGPTTIGYLLEGAVKFGIYEVLKSPIAAALASAVALTKIGLLSHRVVAYGICGVLSGVCASIMLCPMEAIRIRMVAEPNFASNWVSCGVKMLQAEGLRGLCKGLPPMIYKQVPYTVTKNVSFDMLTRSAYTLVRNAGMAATGMVTLTVPLVSAAIASVLSCITSQPGDMLLSLVNAHTGTRTTGDIIKDIRKTDRGLKGLFVGIKTRLLHVCIIVTLQLLIYDYVKRFCGISATGM